MPIHPKELTTAHICEGGISEANDYAIQLAFRKYRKDHNLPET